MKKFLQYAVTLIILTSTCFSSYGNGLEIVKARREGLPNFSGNKQLGQCNELLSKPIALQILSADSSLRSNVPIHFRWSDYPDGASIYPEDTIVFSNEDGLVFYTPKLGSKPGFYVLSASIHTSSDSSYADFSFEAEKGSWVLFMIFGLIGGLALFMLGMHLMSEGIQKSAGENMRALLSKLTNNRFIGAALGAFVTMIIQSSSATSVMLVSFVNSKLMRFRQTVGVLLGAGIGTTITAQLIAFKLTDYALPMIGVGVILYLFLNRQSLQNIGEAILGFGILFYGMKIMSNAMAPLRTFDPFIELLVTLENPVLGILFGALFTALIQSSSAFIGIMIILASQGFLSIESSLALLLGANLGTPVTALLASIKTTTEAKKVAVSQLIIKFILVLLFVWFIPLMSEYYHSLFHDVKSSDILPRQIANAHTLYNVVITIILLPFVNSFSNILNKIWKDKQVASEYKVKYIDASLFGSPILAMSMAKQETLRIGKKIYYSMDDVFKIFLTNDKSSFEKIEDHRDEVKYIRDEVKMFLLKTSRMNSAKTSEETFQILHVINELSHMNDLITKVLSRRAEKWIQRNFHFSEDALKEMTEYFENTKETFKNVLQFYDDINLQSAKAIKKKGKSLIAYAQKIEMAHYNRLISDDSKDIDRTKSELDIINVLKAINQHNLSIVRALI